MAADTGEDVNQLKAELGAQKQRQAELEDRINQLEARQKLTDEKPPTAEPKKEEAIPDILKWASKVNLFGDFRYRYEYIDQREAEVRSRNRIRARLDSMPRSMTNSTWAFVSPRVRARSREILSRRIRRWMRRSRKSPSGSTWPSWDTIRIGWRGWTHSPARLRTRSTRSARTS
jgi:SOS response regulatory protein OraA/RecX